MADRLHAIVHGRVQGVSFRYYTVQRARQLNLTGWVRNLPEGTVETVAEGDPAPLKQFLDFLHDGPTAAHVTQVDVQWQPVSGDFTDFDVRYGYG